MAGFLITLLVWSNAQRSALTTSGVWQSTGNQESPESRAGFKHLPLPVEQLKKDGSPTMNSTDRVCVSISNLTVYILFTLLMLHYII